MLEIILTITAIFTLLNLILFARLLHWIQTHDRLIRMATAYSNQLNKGIRDNRQTREVNQDAEEVKKTLMQNIKKNLPPGLLEGITDTMLWNSFQNEEFVKGLMRIGQFAGPLLAFIGDKLKKVLSKEGGPESSSFIPP